MTTTENLHLQAQRFNRAYPIETPVRYWPGVRTGEGVSGRTCTPAWAIPSRQVLVSVDGYPGGIALSHVEPTEGGAR